MILHVVVCHEKWEENGKSKWAWVSGKAINEKNVVDRCNGGARYRWGIEEHLLTEKKRGYNYEQTCFLRLEWHEEPARHDAVGPFG